MGFFPVPTITLRFFGRFGRLGQKRLGRGALEAFSCPTASDGAMARSKDLPHGKREGPAG